MTFKFPANLSTDQLHDISFLDGLDADDVLVLPSYASWAGDTPATYAARNGVAAKWGAPIAGTTGAVTYYFDTGSNWTTAEEKTFLGAMGLYSDIADITFTQAAVESSASLVFYRYGSTTAAANGVTLDTGYYENSSTTGGGAIGSGVLATETSAYVSAQTQNVSGYGDITSFSTYGGYGVDTIVHELGHVVGLGHTGPYNGNVDSSTQQFNAADTRLYSIMSYINPNDASAKYYSRYSVAGTTWGKTSDGYARAPYTPQIDDILAVQQLYGASSGTTLNQAQTFGFNTTIAATDPIRMFYDFTIDTAPVLTIYDSAPGNTLDLSGYSANSTVDLNPGTFSSVDGLVNNIAIAYDTAVDYFIGGSGADTIIVNSDADRIDGGGGNNTVEFAYARSSYTLVNADGVIDVTDVSTNTTDALTDVATLQFSDQSVATSTVTCYLRGSRILTERGETAVETLAIGDRVVTQSGALRPIRWIGWRGLDCARHPHPSDVWPIRIRRGAFGAHQPHRDLWLSPAHSIATGGALVPISSLVNGLSVAQIESKRVEYWHIELDAHDVIFAEGLPAESYLDSGNRTAFANGGAFIEAHADFRPRHWAETCLPIVTQGPAVFAAKAQLLACLEQQGCGVTQESDAHLWVDGRRIEPIRLTETRFAFALPSGGREIALRSRVFIPAHALAESVDPRALGLSVARLQVDGLLYALDDDEVCAAGWHGAEWAAERFSHRWTTGETPLPAGARIVIVDLAGVGAYRRRGEGDDATLFG